MNVADREFSKSRSTLVGFALAALGFLVATVLTVPVFVIEPGALDPDQAASRTITIAAMVLNFAGFVVAGAIYLAYTNRGWSYVDLRWPTVRDWKYVGAGIGGSILFLIGYGVVTQALGLESAPNQVIDIIGEDTTLLLAMFVIVFFANAPAEEFLFRNIIQKRLYEAFSKGGAIVVASLIFTIVHVPAFMGLGVEPMIVSLVGLFGGSIVFGYIYARTENLVVPTLAHAGFNAFQFLNLYVVLEYGDPDALETAMVLVFL